MRGVEIRDHVSKPDGSYIPNHMPAILGALGDYASRCEWRLSNIECSPGPGADDFHALADRREIIDAATLGRAVAGVHQLIDGCFDGFLDGRAPNWIYIRAVDSSCYWVYCREDRVLAAIKAIFLDVVDLEDDGR